MIYKKDVLIRKSVIFYKINLLINLFIKVNLMGEIKVQLELENHSDKILYKHQQISKSEIRTYSLTGIVDTGAVMLMLPQDVVEKLGLEYLRRVIVTYADDRRDTRDIAGSIIVKIGDRTMISECIVGPPNSEPLIGQIIMEGMDLIADPQRQTLLPRPESPIYPSMKMK